MLIVPSYVARSKIHGLGLFSTAYIKKGTVIWRYDPKFDVEIPRQLLMKFTESDIETVTFHAEYIKSKDVFILGNDGDIFMNHCEAPNLTDLGELMVASRDITADEELTCDYNEVQVVAFNKQLK